MAQLIFNMPVVARSEKPKFCPRKVWKVSQRVKLPPIGTDKLSLHFVAQKAVTCGAELQNPGAYFQCLTAGRFESTLGLP